jgi:non-haem dioxygenase in morphine synthesis N-terminal
LKREEIAVPYVPIVDISADPDVVGAELDEVCRTVGFFQITGHGIADEIAEPAWRLATAFFDLPLEDKLSVARPAPDYPYGYIPLAGESLSRSITGAAPPDLKEVFNIGPPAPAAHELADPDESWVYSPNLWPEALPELQQAWTAYYDALGDLGNRLMALFARGLGLPPGFLRRPDRPGPERASRHQLPGPGPCSAPGPAAGGCAHRLRHADHPAAGRGGRPGSTRPERHTGRRGTRPRRVGDQHRRPDGALDERPVAFDPAQGGRSA